MFSLAKLLATGNTVNQSRMVGGGVAVWAVWSGQASKALTKVFREHGGIQIAGESGQAIWFFQDKEAFRALGRLSGWLAINPQKVCCAVMPATLLVGFDMSVGLSLASELREQTLGAPADAEIWIHSKLLDTAGSLHGAVLRVGPVASGLAQGDWRLFRVESGFSIEPDLSWYFIIRPLGKKLEYTPAWRNFHTHCENLLQRQSLKHIYTDSGLFLAIDSLRMLFEVCRDISIILKELKTEGQGVFWPLVMAVTPRKGLTFNDELANKVALDWLRLTPGFIHMRYRDALFINEDFSINEVGFASSQGSLDDWCSVSLRAGGEERKAEEATQMRLPRRLMSGLAKECYYCGLKSHESKNCPSKAFTRSYSEVWEEVARMPLAEIKAGVNELDKSLGIDPNQGINAMLHGGDRQSLLLKAILDIAHPFQLQFLRRVWCTRAKEWSGVFMEMDPEEGEIYGAMDRLQACDTEQAEAVMRHVAQRQARGFRLKSFQGLLCMEQGDLTQALYYFQEAGRLAHNTPQRVAMLMCQGRVHEHGLELEKALTIYREVEAVSRGWLEPRYRQVVCLVKMGFADHAMGQLQELIIRQPQLFHRVLLDPELDRGRYQIQSAVGEMWNTAVQENEAIQKRLEAMGKRLSAWFPADHEYGIKARAEHDYLCQSAKIANYVAFNKLAAGCAALEQEAEARVNLEVEHLGRKVEFYYERLKGIVHEASWFPFPFLLREFNREFNACAEKLTWIAGQYLKTPETFKRAQENMAEIEELQRKLQKQLLTLRILRDGSFFVLLLGRSYVWLQLVALGLALLCLPVISFLADNSGGYLAHLVSTQKWQIQKGLILILSALAMLGAAMRTAVSFEVKKKLFYHEEFLRMQERRQDREQRRREEKKARIATRKPPGGRPAVA